MVRIFYLLDSISNKWFLFFFVFSRKLVFDFVA
ncbi:hypothetical protein A5887_001869, partial [Enterococcus faecium]